MIFSPNSSPRMGWSPTLIVMHITAGSAVGALAWLRNTASQASAHFLIDKTGTIHQLVGLDRAAWHCGKIVRPTCPHLLEGINPNLYSIGIEHEGLEDQLEYPQAQLDSSRQLIKHLTRIYGDLPIVRHREIHAGKSCPANLPIERIIS